MKVNTQTTTGHYSISIQGELVEAKHDELVVKGIVQGLLYRDVFAALRDQTGAKRKLEDSAPFDKEVGSIVQAAVAKALAAYVSPATVNVSEYIGGEGGDDKPTKEATALWTKIQGLPEAEFEQKLVVLGLGDDYTDEQAVLAIRNKLREARQRAAEQAKTALGV